MLLFFVGCTLPLSAWADWPQLRGPGGDGHAPSGDPPLIWSEEQHVTWKVDVPGRGFSSPVVLEGKIWLTTALEDKRSLRLLGWSARSGELLHDVEVFRPATWQASHLENSYASPTPVLEAGRVYVHFGAYGTAALRADTAEILWRTVEPLRIDHEVGPGSSPILYRDLLILNCDGTDERFVAALNKHTGDVVWKAPRSIELGKKGAHRKAFSTPLVVNYQGRDQLISTAAGQVSSYDPLSGEEIWRLRYEGYSNVPRPVAGFGRVFVTTGYMKPHLLAIHLGGAGDVTDSRLAWSYRWQVPANPSPLLIGERLYIVNDQGNATWLDVHQGTDLWRKRLGGKHYASPIYAGGRIYNFSVDGSSVVLAADDTFQQLAVNHLNGAIRASPAVSEGAFFIRTEQSLYRIETKVSR